jgi:hypothetical protein
MLFESSGRGGIDRPDVSAAARDHGQDASAALSLSPQRTNHIRRITMSGVNTSGHRDSGMIDPLWFKD